MKLLVWNIQQGGGRRRPRIVERVNAHDPDILVFVEFVESTSGEFLGQLALGGWTNRLISKPVGANHQVCVLSKRPVHAMPSMVPVLDDSGLWLEVVPADHDVRFGVVHVPTGNCGIKQSTYLDGLAELARQRNDTPFLFVGDFNTGRHPVDWTPSPPRGVRGFERLIGAGFTDAWRHFHGERTEYTYSRKESDFRIDHALASDAALKRIVRCDYSHREREESISDHSILLLELKSTA